MKDKRRFWCLALKENRTTKSNNTEAGLTLLVSSKTRQCTYKIQRQVEGLMFLPTVNGINYESRRHQLRQERRITKAQSGVKANTHT